MNETLLVADFSALEIAILADLTLRLFNDDQMAKAVAPGAPDIHAVNARYVWGEFLGWTIPDYHNVDGKRALCTRAGERVDAIPAEEFKAHPYGSFLRGLTKTVFFGFCYGKTGFGFATLQGADGKPIGEELGNALCDGLLKAMPGLAKYARWVEEYVDEHHGIYSLDGRWCDLAQEMSGEEWQRRRAYRRARNYPAQATGAGIMGDAMRRVHRCGEFRALGYRTILSVHDELVTRGPLKHLDRARELLVTHMTSATANGVPLLVPLQVSTGHGENYWMAK